MIDITQKYKFNISTNSVGQRVLIVGDDYRQFVYEQVPFEDFDAIFFGTEDHVLLKRQLMSIITVENSPNYSFKAIFFKPAITHKAILAYADGVCPSIESPELIQETRRIHDRFVSMKFRVYDREPSFWTPERRVFHVLRLYLIRSDKFPEWRVQRQSALGYAIPRLEMLVKYKYTTIKVVMQYLAKLCEHYKLLETSDLKAVIHICPHCYENRLLWQEVCPKCGTIDIEEEHMIHHFRCANISAEESYLKDGKLICPKCRHELKHIGVDYDRPASMFYCKENGIHFSEPMVKALCANCNKTSDLSELRKRRLYQLEYTAMGVATFAQYDHVQDSDSVPKLPSIYSYKSFIQDLKIRIDIARHNPDLRIVVYRLRITPESDELADRHIIKRIYSLYPNAIISYKDNTYYVLQGFVHETTEEIAAKILRFKAHNDNYDDYNFDGDYMELDVNVEIDRIIAQL